MMKNKEAYFDLPEIKRFLEVNRIKYIFIKKNSQIGHFPAWQDAPRSCSLVIFKYNIWLKRGGQALFIPVYFVVKHIKNKGMPDEINPPLHETRRLSL